MSTTYAAVVDHVTNKEVGADGKFNRQANRFTTPFGEGEGKLPVEKGRYRLLWTPACPWATRSMIVRELLGLEDVISVGTLDPIRPEVPWSDWAFTWDDGGKDPVLGIKLLSEAYKKADPDYNGRFTVPAIVDLQTGAVVNNDYFNLTLYYETAFKKFHKENAPDLYPEHLREEIDKLNAWIFHDVNNGVYKAGFAQSQAAYEDAYHLVFNALDELEKRLETKRFLCGDYITESDIRLYVTLARFDVAYYNGFRVNKKLLKEYPNLWGYSRDLYEEHAFSANTDFDSIKKHYHLCCLKTNPDNILPLGPDLSAWNEPHDRAKLSGDPSNKYLREN
ncbi:MAG: glutathione S-transferase C-terminal domain-containing protein [Lachnospiraceae bacterium]|nr:glutathione S-transferase C-terminal domain-containing protein [Lachnospiraceae bacterium]